MPNDRAAVGRGIMTTTSRPVEKHPATAGYPSPRAPVNILFTSVGRRVELLRGFRHAYQALGLSGQIIACDIDELAPGLHHVDKPYIVPRTDSPDYIPALQDICRRERVSIVFPLSDGDVSVLASNRDAIQETGARLMLPSEEAVKIVRDKWLTTQFFRRLGIATPCSWLPKAFDPASASYPVFIKPRDGSASVNSFVAHNQDEARFFLEYVPFPIIQERLPGPEITTDIACGFDSEVLGIVSRQRIAVRSGEVIKGVTVYCEEIIDACRRIACALPGIGPITVQCMYRDGLPHFTEINARFGGGVPLSIAAGVDIPSLLLAHAACISVPTSPVGAYKVGLSMTRFDDSLFLTEDQRVQVVRNYL
jgi:carbamoyl-phosphate synthase large subunit